VDGYRREDSRLRAVYLKSSGLSGADRIREATGCTREDAWRIATIRDVASGVLLDRWTSLHMTWRKLWRLVTDHPLDLEAQVRASEHRRNKGLKIIPRESDAPLDVPLPVVPNRE
jgi:hypothetical protein